MNLKDDTFTPLRHRVFRELWLASMVSSLGNLIQAVGAGWLMTSLSDSSDMVALVQSSNTLPIMLFALLAGALADNFNRRRIVLTAQLFMFVASVALAIFAWQDWLTPFLLLAFTFLIGCGAALNNPAWQASMGDIVPREDLSSAVSLNSMAFNLMRSVGPALGGFIVAVLGAAVAFAVNAFSYVAMIFVLWRWRPVYPENTLPRESVHHAVAAGLRYCSMSPNLMRVLLRGLVFGFGAVAVMALMPLIARDMLEAGATTYGMLLGFFGFGAIGGALTNAQLRLKFNSETIVRGSFLAFAVSLIALSFSHITAVTCVLLMVAGACWVLTLSLLNVSVQLSTPRWVVGRALALYQMATFGGMAGGSWIWGWLAETTDLPVALLCAGIVLVGGSAMGLWFRLPDLGIVNLDPLNSFKEPDLRLDLTHRSGPIMVMVDYEIEQQDVPEFLKWMTHRRRIRIRDGARQWALLRDLENPDLWTESYHVPTWIEYVRHNLRRTQADAEVADRLRAMHKGKQAPRVHRMIERQTVPVRDDMPLKPLTEPH